MEVKKKILTIDDDPEINALIQHHVSNMGYVVKTTTQPETFLSEFESFKPDLCLIDLDIGLPRSGLIVLQSIVKKAGPFFPLIILSRHEETDSIADALTAGAMDYLIKPPTKERLQSLLQRYAPIEDSDKNAKPVTRKVPGTQSRAEISFPLEWLSVDEQGLWFRSKHLISRGSIFYFRDPEFEKITLRSSPTLLTVSENFLDPGAKEECYKIYGTFDQSDSELLNKVRDWLIKKK